MRDASVVAAQLRKDFTYVPDHVQFDKKEHWWIGPLEGAFSDDCDGYALTALVRMAGSEGDLWRMLSMRTAKIHHVEVLNEHTGNWSGHAILEIAGVGFIESMKKSWHPTLDRPEFQSRFKRTYSINDVQRKIAGKKVYSKKQKALGTALIQGGILYLLYTGQILK